jgi:EAL domain-containing protein (putative c-di-GMP-specific phosphodiesterase class I)/GGDEF domain-containing protein
MAKVKEKSLQRLKRKSFVPSIVLFCLFSMVSIAAILAGVQVVAMYIVGTELTSQYEQAMDTGTMMERYMAETAHIGAAVEDTDYFSRNPREVYVTDANGVRVAGNGRSVPLLDESYHWTMGTECSVYMDSEWDYGLSEVDNVDDIFDLPLLDLMRRTFQDMPRRVDDVRTEWLEETVMEQKFWIQVPTQMRDYRLYVKCDLQLPRQDIINILLVAVVLVMMLLVPAIFLFINALLNVRMQRRMTKLLYTDEMTGGHNWLFFRRYASKMLERRWNAHKTYAMVNLHLERYRSYVSAYGSKEGEALMECMDGFLQARMERREVFAHYAGADFGLIMRCQGTDLAEAEDDCYRRLRSLLAELAGLQPERKLHFHAGVCIIPPVELAGRKYWLRRRDTDIDLLFSYANSAQSTAHTESEQIFFFSEAMLEDQSWEHWVENHMQEALSAGDFKIYLQPKYTPGEEKLVGAEALVRWVCPERGMIPPGRFIPIFEKNGFIRKLDDFMLAGIAKLQAEWLVEGRKAVPISVNLSRAHFTQGGLAEHISQLVDSYGAKHGMIEIEVTESAFFDDKDVLIDVVKQLRAYGFSVSMDDFGAGYSSLNSLKDIPLDVLKLDAEFFRGEDVEGRGAVIVREAINLAKELGMRVVAEGIEQKEQVDFLATLGCDMIQGYYFARPMPVDEFEALMETDM